jgi:hypothetical protein
MSGNFTPSAANIAEKEAKKIRNRDEIAST